jgi:two-component sensor histidine kinase
VRVAPRVLAMRSPDELVGEIEERKRLEEELRLMQVDLARQVESRTAELALANGGLIREVERRVWAEERLEQQVRQRTAELLQTNERLQASLAEKEVLLKEIHHRVKNNLQVISSLLDLQSHHTIDPAAAEMFRDSQLRVRSLALVHERLYRAHDLARVDFAGYLEGLTDRLFQSYRVHAASVRLDLRTGGDVRLPIDLAVPCGLLVNELVSNCLKHAFAGRPGGTVRIEMRPEGERRLLLEVADDGVGLSDAVDLRQVGTFGLQLVAMLADQLKGTVAIDRTGGTAFRIVFPVAKGDKS